MQKSCPKIWSGQKKALPLHRSILKYQLADKKMAAAKAVFFIALAPT